MTRLLDLSFGQDLEAQFFPFLVDLIEQTRKFHGWDYRESFYYLTDPPEQAFCRVLSWEELVTVCQNQPIACAAYSFQFCPEIDDCTLIFSHVRHRSRSHRIWQFDDVEGGPVRLSLWIPEWKLKEIESEFKGAIKFPEWDLLTPFLVSRDRN